jgi:hypothetical protein
MAISKGSGTTLISATTATTTSSATSVSGNYLTEIYIKYSQSSSAATVAATVQILVSPDGTNYFSPASLLVTAPLTASATTYWVLAVPTTAIDVEVTYTAPTTGTGTCTVEANTVTAV